MGIIDNEKADHNVICTRIKSSIHEVVDDVLDAKEINDTQSALDLSYEVVTKLEHQEVDP